MKRLHSTIPAALLVCGFPLMTWGQHDHATRDRSHDAPVQSSGEPMKERNSAHHAHAEQSPAPDGMKQALCPVMGNPIDEEVFVTHEGRKVYFCCKGCDRKFLDEPAAYLPSLYEQIFPQNIQVSCPIMGGAVNPEVFVEHDGRKVYFCCKGCDTRFEADPDRYLKQWAEVSTEQVHCPLTGRTIDPRHRIEFGGKTIYFCSETCGPRFKADFRKYLNQLRPDAGLLARGATAQDDLLLCPVCLPEGGVHRRAEVKQLEHRGFRYATCSASCTDTFKADPGKYAAALRNEMLRRAGGPDQAHTCPMHSQLISNDKGQCPACGTGLITENQRR